MKLFNWFGKNKQYKQTKSKVIKDERNELDKLVESLHLSFDHLHETTNNVSKSASNANDFIKRELKKTQYRFFNVIDSINDIVIIKNHLDQWITVNSFTRELLNLKFNDFYMKTDEEIQQNISNDQIDIPELFSSFLAWNTQNPINETISLKNNNGDIHYFDISKTPTYCNESHDTPKELIIIGRDVTNVIQEQKESKLLADAVNSASDIILIINTEGYIHFCNRSFLNIFEYDTFKEVYDKPISIIKSDKHDSFFYSNIWNKVRNNEPWHGLIRNKSKHGNIIDCECTFIPVMNGKTTPINYIAIMKVIPDGTVISSPFTKLE